MTEIDAFASLLLEESKRFLEKSGESDGDAMLANLHASILLGFASFEAYIASMCDDFTVLDNLSAHERGLLQEKDVRLQEGEFVVSNTLKMVRLEDRIEFLHMRFSGQKIDRSASWWSDLKAAINLRNELTHPKNAPSISSNAVARALQAIVTKQAAGKSPVEIQTIWPITTAHGSCGEFELQIIQK